MIKKIHEKRNREEAPVWIRTSMCRRNAEQKIPAPERLKLTNKTMTGRPSDASVSQDAGTTFLLYKYLQACLHGGGRLSQQGQLWTHPTDLLLITCSKPGIKAVIGLSIVAVLKDPGDEKSWDVPEGLQSYISGSGVEVEMGGWEADRTHCHRGVAMPQDTKELPLAEPTCPHFSHTLIFILSTRITSKVNPSFLVYSCLRGRWSRAKWNSFFFRKKPAPGPNTLLIFRNLRLPSVSVNEWCLFCFKPWFGILP